MALDSKHAHHQLEAGLPGDEKQQQLEHQSPALDFKESRLRRAALRRKMLAFWIIISSPFICLLMTLVISPVFWPGCLSRLSPDLVYHEEHAVAQVQSDTSILVAEGEVLDEKPLDATEELPMTEPRSIVLAKLHRRQDEGANTTSSSSEEETSTEASSTPIDTSTEVSTTTPVDSETSSEVSTPIETSTTTTTSESESTTSESSTTEESSTESTTESTTEVTETSTTPSSTVESETTTSSDESTTTTAEPTSSTTTSEEQTETTTTEERSSTSSPVVATRTETLENGVTTVITSTSWVDVPAPTDENPDASDPELQNAASKPASLALLTVPMAVLAGFALMA